MRPLRYALLVLLVLAGCDSASLDIIDGYEPGDPLASLTISNTSDYVLTTMSYAPCDAPDDERSERLNIEPDSVRDDVISVEVGCYDITVFAEGDLGVTFERVSMLPGRNALVIS